MLLEEVASEFQESAEDVLVIVGGIGWGKSVALAHLAASADAGRRITFLDEPTVAEVRAALNVGKAVIAVRLLWNELPTFAFRKYTLAPWTNDDLIEYLLARHPRECGSVMRRIASAADRTMHRGRPELCVAVIEQMAEDESLATVDAALRREIVASLGIGDRLRAAQQFCMASLADDRAGAGESFKDLVAGGRDRKIGLLRHEPVQLLLAADGLAAALESPRRCGCLKSRLPRQLVELTGPLLTDAAIDHLHRELRRRNRSGKAMAASLIHASHHRWIPDVNGCDLTGAYLAGTNWAELTLKKLVLNNCDLSGSNLERCVFENVKAAKACFKGSNLRGATLVKLQAFAADFSGADLSAVKANLANLDDADFIGADLRGASLLSATLRGAVLRDARLDGADLQCAKLRGATIDGANFEDANFELADLGRLPLHATRISGASFKMADLEECDFEGADVHSGVFIRAGLRGANFTSSRMRGANFSHAKLHGAKLGDVDWEGANLTNAKLRGCTFHFGSSRSGLVNSTIAGEGSRTGFYTDDFDQQTYQPPEEIRKANLCGVDLTGADLTDTDFYLVDLRGAKYSPEQFEHLRRCGAILFDRE
jgi:uncharacterized protein YjbI with pentapeptide repeats